MHDVFVHRLVVLAALLAGCPAPAAPKQPEHPRLVVLIVIDQLPSWTFEKEAPAFIGGFARLMRDGAYVPKAELPYANTFTAPGHAAIGTGATPRVTGVVGNVWWRRIEERERAAEYDADSPVLTVGGAQGKEPVTDDLGASSRALRVDGLADVLRTASGGRAHSIAVALKARAACFVAGKHPDMAVWYEPAAGGMTTSKAYAATPPGWLVALAHQHPASRYFGATWEPRAPQMLEQLAGGPDAAPGEGGEHGLDSSFPHTLAQSHDPEKAIVMTPFGDELVMSTVAAALDAMELGRDDVPDLLAISLNAHDFAGHTWGPDSWEVYDLTLRLDAVLGQLFDSLDARYGKNGWSVVLTSDHGATPLVERKHVASARRVPAREVEAAAEQAMQRVLGPGPWIAKLSSDNMYVTPAFGQAPPELRSEALDKAVAAIRAVPNIAAAGRVDQFGQIADCSAHEGLDHAICEAMVPGDAGEIYVFPAQGSLVTDFPTGTHHDAPFDDNRQVPILVMAPGLAAQTGTGSLLQVAPTVASLLGIPAPPAATLPPLFGLKSYRAGAGSAESAAAKNGE
jgi:hypothetical protein